MKPTAKDIRLLRSRLSRMERNEAYFQDLYSDPEPGSIRIEHRREIEALRRAIDYVSGEKTA